VTVKGAKGVKPGDILQVRIASASEHDLHGVI
jgi:hypothetical protein